MSPSIPSLSLSLFNSFISSPLLHHQSSELSCQTMAKEAKEGVAEEELETMFSSSPRLSSASSASSHEFSFWPSSSNPSSSFPVSTPLPDLSSADRLFSNGVLLPTVSSSTTNTLPPELESRHDEPEIVKDHVPVPVKNDHVQELELNPASITAVASTSPSPPSSSKRWKEIFKIGDKEKPARTEETKKKSKKDRKPGSSNGNGNVPMAGSVSSADISINIWPFGRSRSAGTASSSRKPASVQSMCKSSSAPCSRSNSRGESGKPNSAGRRWAASPGRNGVHVGRSSPVWQIKRNATTVMSTNKPTEPGRVGSGPGSARVINFSVNSCIGYGMRDRGRCGGESKDGVAVGVAGVERHGGLFRIKGLFGKKPVH